jgi:uncharacterized repeat protein (TIGR01451 family)
VGRAAAVLARAPARLGGGGVSAFPWRKPSHELLLLALVAVATLSPVYHGTDAPRVCLSEAVLHGRLSNDACLATSVDRSSYGGHLYSDKAPGVSLLEVPLVAVLQPGSPATMPDFDLRLWGVRVLSVGAAFLVCAFLVGRIGEGLAPGYGGLALATFALGTLFAPLAATSLDEVLSAALGFAAFALAWRRRAGPAGIAAGAAVVVSYDAALTVVVLAAYVALQGRRPLLRFLACGMPWLALLGAYDRAAFGAPWHLSYSYVSNQYADLQTGGLFGIGVPHLFGIVEVFAGSGGLLVVSPVLVLAAYGLVLFGREHRAEAIVCAVVAAAFVLLDTGYFLPYGGLSPGPRFLSPGLPFLAVGLAPAFRARPRLTTLAAAASIVPVTALTLTWSSHQTMRQTVWGELVRVPAQLGRSRLVANLVPTVLKELGPGPAWGAALIAACAAGAFAVALRGAPRPAAMAALRLRPTRTLAVAAACVLVVAGADVCAVLAYPYGTRTVADLPYLVTSISGSTATAAPGGEVDFVITVADTGTVQLTGVSLTIGLPDGMQLLGPPAVEQGPGCSGEPAVVCDLGSLDPGSSTAVRLGVKLTGSTGQTLHASSSSDGNPGRGSAAFAVQAGIS